MNEESTVILSFDIGTTNIKAIGYMQNVPVYSTTIGLKSIENGIFNTQDSRKILENINEIIRDTSERFTIKELVLSVPMHTIVILDQFYNPISNLMTWSDRRGSKYLDSLSTGVKDWLKEITNTQVHSMSPLSKLLWLKDQSISYKYISDLKSYLMYHLTGQFVTDVSSASASGLMDVSKKKWSKEVCAFVCIDEVALPTIKDVNEKFKAKNYDFWIVIGSTDGVMANRGIGAGNNEIVISIGTSIGVRYLANSKVISKHHFSYDAGHGQWLNGVASNNGGNLFDYVKKNLDNNITYEGYAELLKIDLPDIYCAPFVYGERGVWWQENLEVNWSTDNISPEQKAQTLLLGLYANLKIMVDSINLNKQTRIYVTGNFFSNPTLRQFTSDVLGRIITYVEEENAVCFGGLNLIYKDFYNQIEMKEMKPHTNTLLDDYIKKASNYIKNSVENRKR